MENWQAALLLLVAAWLLQAAGTWAQMRHYREALGAETRRWPDGWLGVGNARGALRKGVIAVVVTDTGAIVRRVLVMGGWSIFAKFTPVAEWEGMTLDQLAAASSSTGEKGRGKAIAMAIEQIRKAESRRRAESAGAAAEAGRVAGPPVALLA